MTVMAAALFDQKLRYVKNYPKPQPKPGWVRVQVRLAGICKTDMEIMKGYMGFEGILGHEFVGVVDQCNNPKWIGKRVVGEINAACGKCGFCRRGLGRHCRKRTTLGIVNHDGCMAEFCLLPVENLFEVPADIPDERAVMTEPLSAACELLEQITVREGDRVIVLGDGRMGILCAWVLVTVASDVTVIGHHREKLRVARWRGIKTTLKADRVKPGADIVIEATGSGQGLAIAMSLCKPRGTIVLKSTIAHQEAINLSSLVVNEQTVIGSRCGRFGDGLAMMQHFSDMPLGKMITGYYPLEQVKKAFVCARQGHAIKVLLDIQK